MHEGVMADKDLEREQDLTLKLEAKHIVKEVAYAVDDVRLSSSLPMTDDLVHMNLTTKEQERFCVELTTQGFKIVGRDYDTVDESCSDAPCFETVYSLLDNISPQYRDCFGNALVQKLENLKNQGIEDSENG